jgi:hypothetical protein
MLVVFLPNQIVYHICRERAMPIDFNKHVKPAARQGMISCPVDRPRFLLGRVH